MSLRLRNLAPRRSGKIDQRSGFSLVEMMITIALIGTLSSLAVPAYMDSRETARVARAASDVAILSLDVQRFKEVTGRYPDTLAEAGVVGDLDPWGYAYRYLKIEGEGPSVTGSTRKDRFLVPLNSDFDLYSVGKDNGTRPPLAPAVSHDDVVRANNGLYVGLGSDF